MPDSKKDRLDELQQYTIPAAKYFWISGPELAIHKGFLKYYTLTVIAAGAVLTLVTEHTNLWYLLAGFLWRTFFIKLWYITLPVLGVGAIYLYWRAGRSKKRKIEQKQLAAKRRKMDDYLNKL